MKKLNINVIRIDGGTQSRVEISDEAVSDYAEAVKQGVEFPPVIAFHDGVDHWLADGFHRFHAHKQAGKASIAAEVRQGTKRDAILYSLNANSTHGLRRTNADKRKAVQTLLADAEWAAWSDRKIADACGVGHPLVAALRSPEVAAKQQENRASSAVKRAGKVESDSTAGVQKGGRNSGETVPAVESDSTRKAELVPAAAEEFGPSDTEIATAQRAQQDELEGLLRIAQTDDKLATALEDNKKLRAQVRILTERVNSLMGEKNAAIRAAKSWQRKAEAQAA